MPPPSFILGTSINIPCYETIPTTLTLNEYINTGEASKYIDENEAITSHFKWTLPTGWQTSVGESGTFISGSSIVVIPPLSSTTESIIVRGYANGQEGEIAALQFTRNMNTFPISGASLVCSYDTTFTINLPTTVESIVWSCGPNLNISSGQNTTSCTFSATGNSISWVKARLIAACGGDVDSQIKEVWAATGTPLEPTDIQFFPYSPCLNQDIIAVVSSANPSIAGVHYEWSGTHNYVDYSPSGSEVHFRTLPRLPYITNVIVTSANGCGPSSEYSELLTVKKCGGGIPPAPAIAYPNPASTEIEITIGEESSINQISGINSTLDNGVYDISVLNSQGMPAYKGKIKGGKIKISVLGWQKGVYHYGISKPNRTVSGTFIVE